jgi:hypothetical protein
MKTNKTILKGYVINLSLPFELIGSHAPVHSVLISGCDIISTL